MDLNRRLEIGLARFSALEADFAPDRFQDDDPDRWDNGSSPPVDTVVETCRHS